MDDSVPGDAVQGHGGDDREHADEERRAECAGELRLPHLFALADSACGFRNACATPAGDAAFCNGLRCRLAGEILFSTFREFTKPRGVTLSPKHAQKAVSSGLGHSLSA